MAVLQKPMTAFSPNVQVYLIYKRLVPYTCRAKDKTSLVIMANINHAYFVRNVLESHYAHTKTWPDIYDNEIFFNFKHVSQNSILSINSINSTDIFDMCISMNLNACIIEDVTENKGEISVKCNVIEVQPRIDTYRNTLESIYLE
jgi:hypothetical protein